MYVNVSVYILQIHSRYPRNLYAHMLYILSIDADTGYLNTRNTHTVLTFAETCIRYHQSFQTAPCLMNFYSCVSVVE